MAISFTRYVNITSGLGAGTAVAQRDLILRLITTSSEQPTGMVTEFTDINDVRDRFGSTSVEFLKASFYFSYISKAITKPNKISFARWANADTAPTVLGGTVGTLAQLQAVSAGGMTVNFGGVEGDVSSVDLSTATSFTDIAATVETAVIASASSANFDAATFTYDATKQRFLLTGGAAGAAIVSVTSNGATPDLATLLGLTVGSGALFSNGVDEQSITDVLAESTQISNNFGSFSFSESLTPDQITEAATWNDGNNVLFQFHTQVLPDTASAISSAVLNLGGVGLTLNLPTLSNEYPELIFPAAQAAINYTRRASVISPMFIQASLTPTVTTDADANLYDGLRVNYYGNTQTAGQTLSFYQRGFLTGIGTDPLDMGVFSNEQWFKDLQGSRIMSLLLNLPFLPANATGRGQLLSVLQGGIDLALLNGTISPGRTLSDTAKVFIEQQTGDPNAFYQVQNSGYWVDAEIVEEVVSGVTEFVAQYTIIYAKNATIRKVEGSHVLV